MSSVNPPSLKKFWLLLLGCIGVVYGDIGTSPLYAFREAAHQVSEDGFHQSEILGILSLIIWSLIIIVTLKYVLFLLRVDNRGEGGILSLMSLIHDKKKQGYSFVFLAGIIGMGLFYGDAAITPAISVLSAVEGLKLVTPAFEHSVLPISIFILLLLFMAQKHGTARVSSLFGPITVIWFLVIAVIGVISVAQTPSVLLAFSPHYALVFLLSHHYLSFLVLGSVFLAITGAEALYADLGHFGRKPIQRAWIFFVFPSLVLNYLGQGALIARNPEALENPFFLMVPEWFLLPLVILAAAATIIASQAVITGAYSLTSQAIKMGIVPRLKIMHTSEHLEGQIYMPKINNFLLIAVILLCLIFQTSSSLASAYGISVVGTMIATSCLAFVYLTHIKKKPLIPILLLFIPLFLIEGVFMASNLTKIMDGGIVPVMMAGGIVLLIMTWVKGSRYLAGRSAYESMPMEIFGNKLVTEEFLSLKGTGVFLTSDPEHAPPQFLQNLKFNKVLHEHNIILHVKTERVPKVLPDEQHSVFKINKKLTVIILHFGFLDTPDIPSALFAAQDHGLDFEPENVTYYLGRRKIVSDPRRGLPLWQDNIYIWLINISSSATDYYKLPRNRVFEISLFMAI